VNTDRVQAKRWRHYLHYFLGGLRKIPIWKAPQDLYRGVNLDLVSTYPKKYKIGNKINWYSCTSATTHLQTVTNFLSKDITGTIFVINGVFSGRSLSSCSAVPNESEVIIPPASRFEIMSIIPMPNMNMIQLKQLPSVEKTLQMEWNRNGEALYL